MKTDQYNNQALIVSRDKRGHLYALRRTLPLWCYEDRLGELLSFCSDAKIDEVILKVDAEEFSHGFPTLDWVDHYIPYLARAKSRLNDIGVVFSLNPWVTLGMLDRGRDCRDQFPDFDWMIGHHGERCHASVCPLSQGWREYLKLLWERYASLRPHVLWIEDDIRTFNHIPAEYGCFCPLHLEAFSGLVGKSVDREQLVDALLRSGDPHPWRKLWFKLQSEAIEQVCSIMADVVHQISPESHFGLMSSGPENHNLCGRRWLNLKKILSRHGQQVYSRPPLGSYSESSPRDLYYSAAQIKRTRSVFSKDVIEQTEIENNPFTQYSKSHHILHAQMAISMMHGCDGVTMNLFDHMGSPISIEADLAEALLRVRPWMDSIGEVVQRDMCFPGVRILMHESASEVRRLSTGEGYSGLVPNDFGFERLLNVFGCVTTYEESNVMAADGRMIAAYPDDEIESFLSNGLLLDLGAAHVLISRGYGKHIGVDIDHVEHIHATLPVAAEELVDDSFGGAPGRYVTMTIPDLIKDCDLGWLSLHQDARCISRLVDNERQEICPFFTIYENDLGGRVAVVPMSITDAVTGISCFHPYRCNQYLSILKWLSKDSLSAVVDGGKYPLSVRADAPDHTVLAVTNLSYDTWQNIQWKIHAPYRDIHRIERLTAAGSWGDLDSKSYSKNCEYLCIRQEIDLPFGVSNILVVRWV